MSHKYLVLLIITIFSCNSLENKKLEYLENSLNITSEKIREYNEFNYSVLEGYIVENEENIRPIKNLADTLNLLCFDITYAANTFNEENNNLLNNKLSHLHKLAKNIYKDSIEEMKSWKEVKENLDFNMQIFDNFNLTIIKSKIRIIEYLLLQKLMYDTKDNQNFNPNKLIPIIQVKNKYLKKNDVFDAKISLIGIDTTNYQFLVIDSDTLKVKNGKLIYRKKVTELDTNTILKGKLKADAFPYNGFYTYDFQLKYSANK
jgi:hypothetical protein